MNRAVVAVYSVHAEQPERILWPKSLSFISPCEPSKCGCMDGSYDDKVICSSIAWFYRTFLAHMFASHAHGGLVEGES